MLQTLIALGVYFGFEGRLKKHGAYDPTVYLLGVWVCLTLCSLGRLADGDKSGRKLEWARLLMLLPALLLPGALPVLPLLAALAAAAITGLLVRRAIGGQTGDALGTAAQGCEILGYGLILSLLP